MSGRDARRARASKAQGAGALQRRLERDPRLRQMIVDAVELGHARWLEAHVFGDIDLSLKSAAQVHARIDAACIRDAAHADPTLALSLAGRVVLRNTVHSS